MAETAPPNKILHIISMLNTLCSNSCPPLKPIANKRYKEINLEEFGGISKSLFTSTANTPNTKNKSAGLVRLSKSRIKIHMNLLSISNLKKLMDCRNHNT